MRITSLKLKDIGVFEDETIEFKPCPVESKAEIHILTGTNGSGKSTVLKALAAAFEATRGAKETVYKNDTNKLSKYLRHRKSVGKLSLTTDDGSHFIEYSGSPDGANHLHILSEDAWPIEYYRQDLKLNKRPFAVHFFALFAYSGYRLMSLEEGNNDQIYNKNPLFESLEFVKQPNPAFSINSWIKTSLLKRSYAQTEGLKHKEQNYKDTIQKLEKAIGEIIGFDVKFKLDNQLRESVISYNNVDHDLEVLPDGLKSIISWLADLCMRLEGLDWVGDVPVFDRNIILFLDEIEVHLHIEWQRKILPVIQELLPNAQIFISTHSPFVVNSVDDAWVYNLEVKEGNAKVRKVTLSQDGNSVSYVLRSIFGVKEKFGLADDKEVVGGLL